MSSTNWFTLVGILLLVVGFAAPLIRRFPLTPAMIYLAVGLCFGPTLLGLYHFNPLREAALLEVLTEVVILISLFAAGVKMPVPFSLCRWRTPILLAFLSMAISVGLVAVYGVYLLDLPAGAAVILGAVLAPTDPVLATDVQIEHPGQRDRLRFKLTAEAGMNDGSAFPFVMLGLGLLGLHDIGESGWRWLLKDVLWSTSAGILVGVICGWVTARAVDFLTVRTGGRGLLDDFIALGLIAVVYGICLRVDAWGFLAVFFAAVSLRQTEQGIQKRRRTQVRCLLITGSDGALVQNPPVRNELASARSSSDSSSAALPVSHSSLVFKEHLERLSEVILILMLGGALFVDSWSIRAVCLALFLFCVVRPLSVFIGLSVTRCPRRLATMLAWFGVRGIGSLYYLMYVIQHGLPEPLAIELIHLTLVVVVLSIIVHGISVKPLLKHFYHAPPLAP